MPGWWLDPAPGHGAGLAFRGLDPTHHEAELQALTWLGLRLPGLYGCPPPGSASDGSDDDHCGAGGGAGPAWFLTPRGWPADAPENQIQARATVAGLGRALARLHAVPPIGEVAHLDATGLVEAAGQRIEAGLVDPANFDRARRHLAPQVLLDQLWALVPLLHQRRPVAATVTHGRARPGTLWLERGELTAVIGVAGLAVADPYRDLGAMARHLASSYGPEALPGFFAAYGLEQPDPIRVEFHALLDELH